MKGIYAVSTVKHLSKWAEQIGLNPGRFKCSWIERDHPIVGFQEWEQAISEIRKAAVVVAHKGSREFWEDQAVLIGAALNAGVPVNYFGSNETGSWVEHGLVAVYKNMEEAMGNAREFWRGN